MSFTGSLCHILPGSLHKTLSALAGKSEFFVKDISYFIQLLKSVVLQSLGTLVSFESVSTFTNFPVDEVLRVTRNKIQNDHTIMELLKSCLRTT
jgi:hypothetical protein